VKRSEVPVGGLRDFDPEQEVYCSINGPLLGAIELELIRPSQGLHSRLGAEYHSAGSAAHASQEPVVGAATAETEAHGVAGCFFRNWLGSAYFYNVAADGDGACSAGNVYIVCKC